MKPNVLVSVVRAALASLCLVLAVAAHAQFGGGGGRMGRGARSGSEGSQATQPAGPSLSDQLYQARIRLLIANDQSAAWERFYAAALALQQAPASFAQDSSLTAPQAMQFALDAAQNRYTRTQALADALKALYAQLDENQRHTADDILPPLLMAQRAGTRGAREAAGQ